jgi:hypothetical protein
MLEREYIRRDQLVRLGQPAFVIGCAVIGNDQVEIEHQPIELLLAQTTAIEENGPARRPVSVGNRIRHGDDPRIDWLAELGLH